MAILLMAVSVLAARTPAEIEEYARKLLLQAYHRQDVQAFCGANPDSVYQVEVGGNGEVVAILVRCRAYHDWLATQK
jgi:hypothetical protein